ncbi:hypothetical protein CNR22_20445 [Sphingobacteriaceae bacterium]|nr:hypothetical protein CNR22_20445 [Sphingobacteriaceae bacterium]
MPKQKSSIWFILFCLVLSNTLLAQISSTSGPINLCAPSSVSYSSPAGASSVTWNFGAYGTFNIPSGNFNVTTASTFNAVFSGIVNGSNVTFTVPVAVHAKPTASFSVSEPANSCAPKTVTLTDVSTFSSPLQNWQWVYGDGNQLVSSTGGTHAYTYTSPGAYSIALIVTDANGCDAQYTYGPITVINPPIAIINSNPALLTGCSSTFAAAFSASNSVGSNLSYNWDFGNGQTSTQMTSSSITFTSQSQSYPVTLTVSAGGCTAVALTYVTVSPATLSVVIPGTLCLNAPSAATVTTNQPFTSWNLGNGNSIFPASNSSVTVISIPGYTASGIYTITVSAGSAPCIATPIIQTVIVDQVTAAFTGPSSVSCSSIAALTFTNQSSANATQYSWTYSKYPTGSSLTNTLANPTLTFTQGSINPYTIFYSAYVSTVNLVVNSAAGCIGTASHVYTVIERPTAWFNKDKKEGCSPLTVNFRDSSFIFTANTPSPNPITSYTWNSGETPPVIVSGAVAPPNKIPAQSFTYSAAGTYTPFLIIQTANGCTDISFIDTVIVVNTPTINFSFAPAVVCPNQAVQITNLTTNSTAIQHWHVESDDGFFSGCVNDAQPSWKFTHIGTHTISLSGYLHSCKGSSLSPQTIQVKGPIVETRFETNCTNRLNVGFVSTLEGVSNATLNFGDNSSTTFTGNPNGVVVNSFPAHTYSASGDYTVKIEGSNATSGCGNSTFTTVVQVRDVSASFSSSSVSCISSNASFNASASADVLVSCRRGYVWYVDNLPPVEDDSPFFSKVFTSTGIHTITLWVKDVNSCSDTVIKTIRVSSVTPVFSMNSNTVCLSTSTIQLTNTTSQLTDPVTNYSWNFGDGQSFTTTSQAPITHSYNSAIVPFTNYTVSLTALNSVGCSKTVSTNLQVILPPVGFLASPQNLCLVGTSPGTVNFTSQNANSSYTLNYGVSPGSTLITSAASTSYTYANAGSYFVTMQVKNAAGCLNSGSLTINAVVTPTAEFLFNGAGSTGGYNFCSGKLVTFTNVSLPAPGTPTWNLGSGILTNNGDVVTAFYTTPTSSVVAVTLTVGTGAPAYCRGSVTKNFTITAVSAEIALSKTLVCVGDSIKLTIANANNVGSWIWDYGDATPSGTVFAGGSATNYTTHAYTNYTSTTAGIASVSLIYWSNGGACKEGTDTLVRIVNIDPDFKRNNELLMVDSMHCVNVPDLFTNASVSNSSFLNYAWKFSDGFNSTLKDPAYTFTNAGSYQLTLTATGENNCKVSAIKNMTIFPLPTATISGGANCPNLPFLIYANSVPGVVSGTWSPASGMVSAPAFTTASSAFSSSAIASYDATYSLSVTDEKGCVSMPTSTTITIQQPPPVIIWDTTVVVGEPVPINAYVGDYNYTWTPVVSALNCVNCYSPLSTSTVDITYSVSVEDTLHCSAITSKYSIKILPKSSIDVPTAFTPNGDGINDVIYVAGWGIKKLNYFRIFNRYGQLVFETNDLKTGWDGVYRGVMQNIETYVYQASVDTYIDSEPILKTGTFKLIK